MTIEGWNIVLSAIIAVLLAVYGLWLKYVISQQLDAKDSAIEALRAALENKEAEVSRLQRDTAPAITAAYAAMRDHANQMTEESNRKAAELKALHQNEQFRSKLAPAGQLLKETDGISALARRIDDRFDGFFGPEAPEITASTVRNLMEAIIDVKEAVADEMGKRNQAIKAILDDVESKGRPK